MVLTIILLAIIALVVVLGFKNGWDLAKMGAGFLALLAAIWQWFGGSVPTP